MSDVLAVNIGSSSLKFALYTVSGQSHVDRAHVTGLIEGLEPSGAPVLKLTTPAGSTRESVVVAPGQPRMDAALGQLRVAVDGLLAGRKLVAVAHRVVHGGIRYCEPVVVDAAVLEDLARLNPLAPLHQPHNLAGIRACMAAFPDIPQIACFDTAFHSTNPEIEKHFALPAAFYDEGVRRYGFHGLSYAFVAGRLAPLTKAARGKLLMAHLGNGASLCAAVGGKSVATTMGFSALDGLMMGSRSGSVDPGVLMYLMEKGWSSDRISKLLYKESGLLGVSGVSADMRTLRQSDAPAAAFAIDLFTYRIRREAGALVAVMGGLDVIAFTGGIGEHDTAVRTKVCADLAYLGVRLDEQANAVATRDARVAIHCADSTVEIWVLPTDEGRVAAESAVSLLGVVS